MGVDVGTPDGRLVGVSVCKSRVIVFGRSVLPQPLSESTLQRVLRATGEVVNVRLASQS